MPRVFCLLLVVVVAAIAASSGCGDKTQTADDDNQKTNPKPPDDGERPKDPPADLSGLPQEQRDVAERIIAAGGTVAVDDAKVVDVDLSQTENTDGFIAELTVFPELKNLYLTNSGVTSAGMNGVAKLQGLELIDLSGGQVQVGDADLDVLETLPNLRMFIFRGNNNISLNRAQDLRKAVGDGKQLLITGP